MLNTGGNMFNRPQVFLIDYGFADKYIKENSKEHIDDVAGVKTFQGNIVFASPY